MGAGWGVLRVCAACRQCRGPPGQHTVCRGKACRAKHKARPPAKQAIPCRRALRARPGAGAADACAGAGCALGRAGFGARPGQPLPQAPSFLPGGAWLPAWGRAFAGAGAGACGGWAAGCVGTPHCLPSASTFASNSAARCCGVFSNGARRAGAARAWGYPPRPASAGRARRPPPPASPGGPFLPFSVPAPVRARWALPPPAPVRAQRALPPPAAAPRGGRFLRLRLLRSSGHFLLPGFAGGCAVLFFCQTAHLFPRRAGLARARRAC